MTEQDEKMPFLNINSSFSQCLCSFHIAACDQNYTPASESLMIALIYYGFTPKARGKALLAMAESGLN